MEKETGNTKFNKQKDKRCYNCDDRNHLAQTVQQKKRKRNVLNAASMITLRQII